MTISIHHEVRCLNATKAVFFDLYGTLAYQENPVTNEEVSEYLFRRTYEVSPQQLGAAIAFVAFIDYPKHGYRNWRHFLSRVSWRLGTKIDEETLSHIVNLYESRPYRLYPDAADAVINARKSGLLTAIITTGTRFIAENAIKPIREHFDLVMTGFEAGCDKSNPKMYLKALEMLKIKPQEAFVVGDDFQLDFLIPKRLGIKAVLLDRESKNKTINVSAHNLYEAIEFIMRQ
jgi:HAD superfamily hydrolase (TIGR01549 family)